MLYLVKLGTYPYLMCYIVKIPASRVFDQLGDRKNALS